MNYSFSQIASVIEGKILSLHIDMPVRDLLTDSRRVSFPATTLFFALMGPRRDGHSFIRDVYEKGVRCFVVSETIDDLPDANIIKVRNTLHALQLLAEHKRSGFDIPVIGITGSNGKTIVKEWLNQLLTPRYRIVRSPRSFNSQLGVPLSVWEMNESTGLGIFEAGISQKGEMENLARIIAPTLGVFTNIGDAHASGFADLKEKVREKLLLFRNAVKLVYCSDYPELDEGVTTLYKSSTGTKSSPALFTWSRHSEATLRVKSVEKRRTSATITGVYEDREISITIPFGDEASVENAITCWCVLLLMNIPDAAIAMGMTLLHPVAMRLELHEGINNTSIINDSYSADLSSLNIALDFFAHQHQHLKKTVILTDFLEAGQPEAELYSGIAHAIARHNVGRFIGIGPAMIRNRTAIENILFGNPDGDSPEIADRRGHSLNAAAKSKPQLHFFLSADELEHSFRSLHFADETILIKGARTFGLEQINKLFERQTHRTQLEIDLSALSNNLKVYQQSLMPSTRIMAMVKAFSYGSGSFEVAAALQFNKVDYLAVAYADEGTELRKNGITLPVMVMNPDPLSFQSIVDHNLEPEMYSVGLLASFGQYLLQEGISRYPIHVELETGMNRLGFAESEIDALLHGLAGGAFHVVSVFSHLVASEDDRFDSFTKEQAGCFDRMCERIAGGLPYPFLRHILNSSGITRHPHLQYDMVRIGIGMFGIDEGRKEKLHVVSTLKTAVAQVKDVPAGASIGYGRSGVAKRPTRIATVRLGYADGYPRALGNGRGNMFVAGHMVPTMGNVCMDMTMLDITDAGIVNEGDEVIVFGKEVPIEQLAVAAGTIPYELLTGVSQRVKRVYYQE